MSIMTGSYLITPDDLNEFKYSDIFNVPQLYCLHKFKSNDEEQFKKLVETDTRFKKLCATIARVMKDKKKSFDKAKRNGNFIFITADYSDDSDTKYQVLFVESSELSKDKDDDSVNTTAFFYPIILDGKNRGREIRNFLTNYGHTWTVGKGLNEKFKTDKKTSAIDTIEFIKSITDRAEQVYENFDKTAVSLSLLNGLIKEEILCMDDIKAKISQTFGDGEAYEEMITQLEENKENETLAKWSEALSTYKVTKKIPSEKGIKVDDIVNKEVLVKCLLCCSDTKLVTPKGKQNLRSVVRCKGCGAEMGVEELGDDLRIIGLTAVKSVRAKRHSVHDIMDFDVKNGFISQADFYEMIRNNVYENKIPICDVHMGNMYDEELDIVINMASKILGDNMSKVNIARTGILDANDIENIAKCLGKDKDAVANELTRTYKMNKIQSALDADREKQKQLDATRKVITSENVGVSAMADAIAKATFEEQSVIDELNAREPVASQSKVQSVEPVRNEVPQGMFSIDAIVQQYVKQEIDKCTGLMEENSRMMTEIKELNKKLTEANLEIQEMQAKYESEVEQLRIEVGNVNKAFFEIQPKLVKAATIDADTSKQINTINQKLKSVTDDVGKLKQFKNNLDSQDFFKKRVMSLFK